MDTNNKNSQFLNMHMELGNNMYLFAIGMGTIFPLIAKSMIDISFPFLLKKYITIYGFKVQVFNATS